MEPILLASNGTVENIAIDILITLREAGFADADFAMREIDLNNITQLMETDPEQWPPLECVCVSLGEKVYYAVVDGYHRWETAGEILEIERINVVARTYRDQDAVIEAAFQANLRHGLASNKQTRSSYVVWLYLRELNMHEQEPNYKPNITEIARKAGLERSAASRAISRAMRNLEDDTDTGVTERERREDSHTDKLMKAIHTFFDGEHAFLTNKTDERDTKKRAKAIYSHIRRLPREKQTLALLELAHVADAIMNTLTMCTPQKGQTEKRA